MLKDVELQDYFIENNPEATDEKNEKPEDIVVTFSSETQQEPEEYDTDFHLLFRSLITKEFNEFQGNLQEWMNRSPKDEEILSTSLPEALAELLHVQKEYLQLIEVFASLYRNHIAAEEVTAWNLEVATEFNKLILQYTVQHSSATQLKMNARQEMYAELSAPLLLLTERAGLLVITGKITEHESQIITEKTLQKCCDAQLEKLFIDLSGIQLSDRIDAQHLLFLFNGLKILGVKTVLTGISPELAKIFIQSNFDSSNIEFFSTLAHALKMEQF